MGHRTLKRVPLDFAAPLDKVWEGYINPYPGPLACTECDQTGYNPETKKIADEFYDHDGFGELDIKKLFEYSNAQIRALIELTASEYGIFWCPKCLNVVPRLSPEHHSGFCMCTGEEIPCVLVERSNPVIPEPDKAAFIVGGRWTYEYGVAPDGSPTSQPPWRTIGDCRKWYDNITQDEVQALVDADRLWDFTRVPLNEEQREVVRKKMADGGNSWLPYNNGRIPTAEEVNAFQHSGGLFGHDCVNQHILIEARAKRLSVWGKCSICNGSGELSYPDEVIKKLHEEWEEYEPPTGDGYQLWETCSEGSPVSPVFASAEELADWCAENATIFGSEKTSRENWLEMFIGEYDLEAGSLLIAQPGYVGALINAPK